jgi:hypothetical protein
MKHRHRHGGIRGDVPQDPTELDVIVPLARVRAFRSIHGDVRYSVMDLDFQK